MVTTLKKPVTGFGNETGFLNVVTNQKAWLTGFLTDFTLLLKTCRLPRCPDQRSSRHHKGQVHWTLLSNAKWCQKSHVHQIEKATVVINSSCTVVVVILILILVVVFVDCFFIVCIRILELL